MQRELKVGHVYQNKDDVCCEFFCHFSMAVPSNMVKVTSQCCRGIHGWMCIQIEGDGNVKGQHLYLVAPTEVHPIYCESFHPPGKTCRYRVVGVLILQQCPFSLQEDTFGYKQTCGHGFQVSMISENYHHWDAI